MDSAFLMGCLCAYAVKKSSRIEGAKKIALLGIISFLALGLLNVILNRVLGPLHHLGWGLASAIAIFGSVKAEEHGSGIGARPKLKLLGDSSYALYLIHYPLVAFLTQQAVKLGLQGPLTALFFFLTLVSTVILLSILFHLWTEKPLLSFLTKKLLPYAAPKPSKNALGPSHK